MHCHYCNKEIPPDSEEFLSIREAGSLDEDWVFDSWICLGNFARQQDGSDGYREHLELRHHALFQASQKAAIEITKALDALNRVLKE